MVSDPTTTIHTASERKPTQGIYKITNTKLKVKGVCACYIGSSTNIPSRWIQHIEWLQANNHHSYRLLADWQKFGYSAFTFQILEIVQLKKDLEKREQYHIDREASYYNIKRTAERVVNIQKKVIVVPKKPDINSIAVDDVVRKKRING